MSHARRAGSVTIAVFFSRITGLVREVVLNNLIGPGDALDAFVVAFRIPNLLRDLLAEGALSNAFVSVFSKTLAREGKHAAFALANRVVSLLLLLMCLIVTLGVLLAPWIVNLIGMGFDDPSKRNLATELTRILFPFIMCVSLAAVLMGLLNSVGSFGLPASASTVFNITSIACGVALGYLVDPRFGEKSIYGFAVGTLLGGVAQALCMVPAARKKGYQPRFVYDTNDPGVREIVRLMLPSVIGAAAVQVNVLVNTAFASFLDSSSITCLSNAFRLMQLPVGLFGVAIATVTLPTLAKHIARQNQEALGARLSKAIRHTFVFALPSSVGLAVLAVPITELVFERGKFTAEDTALTALALQGYAVGLSAYASVKVIGPAFIALGDAITPLQVSVVGVILNIFFNYLFVFHFQLGILGLSMSTSLIAILNFLQLASCMHRRLEDMEIKNILITFVKLSLACAVMGLVLHGISFFTGDLFQNHFPHRLLRTFLLVFSGGVCFYVVAKWLNIAEVSELIMEIQSRLPIQGYRPS